MSRLQQKMDRRSMTEDQIERADEIYKYYTEEILAMLDDLFSVEVKEVQDAVLQKLEEQFRFK